MSDRPKDFPAAQSKVSGSISLWIFAAVITALLSQTAALGQPPTKSTTVALARGISVGVPAPWFLANRTRNAVELAYPSAIHNHRVKVGPGDKPRTAEEITTAAARIAIVVEQRPDHADAVKRLSEIASERAERPQLLALSNWPAIIRKWTAPLPNPGESEGPPAGLALFASAAVAVDNTLVRFEIVVAPGEDPKLIDQALAIAQRVQVKPGDPKLVPQDLLRLQQSSLAPRQRASITESAPEMSGNRLTRLSRIIRNGLPQPGAALVQAGVGELEVEALNRGANVVVAANSGYAYSGDGGQTFTHGGGTPCIYTACDGDPSLAVGRTVGSSTNVYYSWIGYPASTHAAGVGTSDSLSVSTTNGTSFTFVSDAVFCPSSNPAICTVPDQQHIAADRINASSSSQDQIYMVWRNYSSVSFTPRIVCSNNSGATWSAQTTIDASGDFPRITVGEDGYVYVAYYSGSNIMLHKFSSCSSGLAAQSGFPHAVSAFTAVTCPVPGLDRCNNGNVLSSPTAVEDDLVPNHVYVAWATSTGATNENVTVADSMDGGSTFPRSVVVNSGATARRYMPWLSSYGGVAYVTWYDRSTATPALDDFTRFHGAGAGVKGGNLVVELADSDLSAVDDPECLTWPAAPRSTSDSESCSIQPQLAGVCSISSARCDFSNGCPPGGGTCSTGSGAPKFGDYNGVAALGGRRFAAWASATPPPGASGTAGTIEVYEATDILPSDFFVRDWTTNAGSHDNGQEPSTNPVFYATSDVWNQASATAYAFPASDWILGDAPNRGGPNYAYARVSRRVPTAPTAAAASVSVEFLSADFGLGMAFASLGSEMLNFTAADNTEVTPALSWTVAPTASTHLCLAVQITAPGDPYIPPTLAGNSPGPADPLILQDNNKAQRNLQTTIGTGTPGTEYHAVIHNIENVARDIVIEFSIDPAVASRMQGGSVGIIGGPSVPLTRQGRIVAARMAPGENRWLRLTFGRFSGPLGAPLTVRFAEAGANGPSNGFAIAAVRASEADVVRYDLRTDADVLARLAAIADDKAAAAEAAEARGLLQASAPVNFAVHRAFVTRHLAAFTQSVGARMPVAHTDAFAVSGALDTLRRNAGLQSANDALLIAHQNALQRLDAYLTSEQLAGK
jgi:hypothetical protein